MKQVTPADILRFPQGWSKMGNEIPAEEEAVPEEQPTVEEQPAPEP